MGTRQTTTSKGKYSSSAGETNRNNDVDNDDTSDDDTDDDGVTDVQESMPMLTLPDTESLMERLGEQKPGWDDHEEDEDDKEV